MALIAADNGSADFKPVPQGAHMGRCHRVIDLGTQDRVWQGQPKGAVRKVMIAWELFGEEEDGTPLKDEIGKPLVIAKRYTLSLAEKATLRADLQAWRGRAFTEDELAGFDLQKLVGATAMINVTHTAKEGKTYSNVASISPLPKAMRDAMPAAINKPQYFEVTDPDMELFETFGEKMKELIRGCHEWKKPNAAAKASAAPGAVADIDDDIPW